jgi:hypothetical protein
MLYANDGREIANKSKTTFAVSFVAIYFVLLIKSHTHLIDDFYKSVGVSKTSFTKFALLFLVRNEISNFLSRKF